MSQPNNTYLFSYEPKLVDQITGEELFKPVQKTFKAPDIETAMDILYNEEGGNVGIIHAVFSEPTK